MIGDFTVEPQTDEEKKDCETPDGIRRRLREVYYHHSDPLIHAWFRISEARGMSGEDMYAVLAFEALKRYEKIKNLYIDTLNLMPAPRFPPSGSEKQV